jgi:hypothetical protein
LYVVAPDLDLSSVVDQAAPNSPQHRYESLAIIFRENGYWRDVEPI